VAKMRDHQKCFEKQLWAKFSFRLWDKTKLPCGREGEIVGRADCVDGKMYLLRYDLSEGNSAECWFRIVPSAPTIVFVSDSAVPPIVGPTTNA
jgi:hypothetical protein